MCRCGSRTAQWGWGTADGAQALSYLKRFGSVTVLNGHIHQVLQKVEGHVAFHTARSTAFPQPAPGTAKGPGPMLVPAERAASSYLGIARVSLVSSQAPLAIVDTPLQRLKEPSCRTFCNRAGWPGGWCCAARRAPAWVG